MGFKAQDFVPFVAGGSTITPASKDTVVKVFQVTRTDTTASVKAILPADASIIDFQIAGVASDAGTTATLSVGSTSTSTEYINAQDVKGAGTNIRPTVVGTAILQTEPIPLAGDLLIYAKYAETGTASTVGGPWKVVVTYVR